MPKLNLTQVTPRVGDDYPAPFNIPCKTRIGLNLSNAGGLSQFGAHQITLPPGCWSSQRHHHSAEDEIIYIISGHPTLYENDGPIPLSPGDVTAHPMGDKIAHHMKNETDKDVTFLVVGARNPETDSCVYPDIDLDLPANGTPSRPYQRKDGTPY